MPHGFWLALILLAMLAISAEAGMALQSRLREGHKTNRTADHVRLVASILVTITALVLSLLLSEVKGSFDTFESRLGAFAGDLSNLDIHLREYGGEASPIRDMLRGYVAAFIADNWPEEPPPPGDYPKFDAPSGFERRQLGALLVRVDAAIHRLDPPDKIHQRLAEAVGSQMDATLGARRSLLETAHDTVSWPLMLAMCVWLVVVFSVFGLLAPRNRIAQLSILICAICVASAVFLLDDYDSPLRGLLHVSSGPMRETLSRIDEP